MRSTDKPSMGEYFAVAAWVGFILLMIGACTPLHTPPDGCPLPLYSVGDIVLVDEVIISTILEREVLGCGEIYYKVYTSAGYILEDVAEDRVTPYEPELP